MIITESWKRNGSLCSWKMAVLIDCYAIIKRSKIIGFIKLLLFYFLMCHVLICLHSLSFRLSVSIRKRRDKQWLFPTPKISYEFFFLKDLKYLITSFHASTTHRNVWCIFGRLKTTEHQVITEAMVS